MWDPAKWYSGLPASLLGSTHSCCWPGLGKEPWQRLQQFFHPGSVPFGSTELSVPTRQACELPGSNWREGWGTELLGLKGLAGSSWASPPLHNHQSGMARVFAEPHFPSRLHWIGKVRGKYCRRAGQGLHE